MAGQLFGHNAGQERRHAATVCDDSGMLYEETHPWISFKVPQMDRDWATWQRFGEIRSKCEHLAGIAVPPRVADELFQIYLRKGALASTAIEGNTLTEDEIERVERGERHVVPPSREYQLREVQNIVGILNDLNSALRDSRPIPISPSRIRELNLQVLDGTDIDDEVVPGELRTHSVVVGNTYRGAPAEDCGYLIDRLCAWLNGPGFHPEDKDQEFAAQVMKAVFAHVYLAWIHPFGDGNGRTARALEAQILSQSGSIPSLSVPLLSNHYNLTLDRYLRILSVSSTKRPTGNIRPFLSYATEGLMDGMREQIRRITAEQLELSWRSYIDEVMDRQKPNKVSKRRRKLVLALSRSHERVPNSQIRDLDGEIARLYAPLADKTMTRDLNELQRLSLVRKDDGGWIANKETMEGFKPPVFTIGNLEEGRV